MQRSPFLPVLVLHILRRLVLKNDTLHLWVLNVRAGLLDDLYICDACDGEGVLQLMRSSGKHTEEHHLIRCLAPEKTDDKDEDPPTEQRLTSMEVHLDGMQKQLDDLSCRMGDLTGCTGDLSGRIGDLTGRTGDLSGRVGDLSGRMEALTGQMGALTGQMGDLTGRIGDVTGYMGDLNARIGNIEQLLHKLVGAAEGHTA